MRLSVISLQIAVAAAAYAAAPAAAQLADRQIPLRGVVQPGSTEVSPRAPPDATEERSAEPVGAVDPVETGSVEPEAIAAERVAPVGMIDTSEPPSFVAGNALRRTIDEEPFAPLGIRGGSFVFLPSIVLSSGYTTNTTNTKNGSGAAFAIVSPEFLARSDWSRHEVALSLRGSYETYSNRTEDVPEAEAVATARLDLADRWQGDLRTNYRYGRDSLSDPDLPSGTERAPDIHEFGASAALSGAFGRALFTVEAGAERALYGDRVSGGKKVDQKDRDNTLYRGRLRLGYELTRTFVPFVEGILTNRIYDRRKDDNGIIRTSHGEGARLGIAFDRSPVSSGEIAIGYLRETFEDNALKPISTVTVDGSLLWSPTRLTEIEIDLSSAIDPTTDPDSSGGIVHDGGVALAYALRPNVTLEGEAGARYERFQGTNEVDWTYRVGFDATWQLNRNAAVAAGYVHEWRDSTRHANEYATDTVRIDLTLRQ